MTRWELVMDCDLQLVFKNMPETKAIRRHIEKEVKQLDEKFEGIGPCKVTFDLPFNHRYPGNIYNFEIELDIPNERLLVTRNPSIIANEGNVFALIRDAFNEIDHKISHHKHKQKTKNHASRSANYEI
jgi:ribosome-associated translation inhibitor RaiA